MPTKMEWFEEQRKYASQNSLGGIEQEAMATCQFKDNSQERENEKSTRFPQKREGHTGKTDPCPMMKRPETAIQDLRHASPSRIDQWSGR